MNKKAYWLLIPLVALVGLGGLNVYHKAVWKEPTDGVIWEARPEGGLVAIEVDENGPGDKYASIKTGDVLYAINNIRVNTKIDLAKALWTATMSGPTPQSVTYQINRGNRSPHAVSDPGAKRGQPDLHLSGHHRRHDPGHHAHRLLQFVQAVRSPEHLFLRPFGRPLFILHFSPTGELDLLDSVFYWLDKVAFLVFPPLLLHFFLVFPQRKKFLRNKPSIVYRLLPSGGRCSRLAEIVFHLPYFNNLDNALLLRVYETLEKLNLFHFAFYTFLTLATISDSYFRHPGFLVRKQLKWIVYGLGSGILPFTILYVIPFLAGRAPSKVAELTILLQAFVPLAFSYSISRKAHGPRSHHQKSRDADLFVFRPGPPLSRRISQTKIFLREQGQASCPGHLGHDPRRDVLFAAQATLPVAVRQGFLPPQLSIPENTALDQPGAQPGTESRKPRPLPARAHRERPQPPPHRPAPAGRRRDPEHSPCSAPAARPRRVPPG